MKRTNIRINNFYLIYKDNKYYFTDIDVLEMFKSVSDKNLEKYLDYDVTDEINKYLEKTSSKTKVNFIDEKFERKKNADKRIVFSNKSGG
jgi:hypothetical protein